MAIKDGYVTPHAQIYKATPTLVAGDELDFQCDVNGNTKVSLGTVLDRTNDNITNYPASCTATVVDLATDADVVVTASSAVLLGVYCSTALSAHVGLIKDSVGTKVTLGASTPIGTNIHCHGALMANITVESDNSMTGTITVFWRAA